MIRFRLLLLLLFALTLSLRAQDDEVISVDSSLVVLNATVTDKDGRQVSGLKRSDFTIIEDGKEQETAFFETQSTPFAAVILLDTSGSMEERVSLARSAAMRFLSGLRSQDQTSIYNFDSKISMVQDFSNSRDIYPTVFDLKSNGMTVLNDAIYQAANKLAERTEKRRAIIVLSDGADTLSKRSEDKALKAALVANAVIYTVDMSSIDSQVSRRMQNQGSLKNFAEKSGGRFVATPGGVAMREAFKEIVAELGAQYTLGYQPAVSGDGKWHTISLRLTNPNLIVRTRKGYIASKPRAKN